jgi:diguanylate cyclase
MMGLPLDEMDVEYAASIADRAIQSMCQQSVPATPSNFTVWFNYVLGTSPTLRKTIDVLLLSKRRFDVSINRELYTTFVSTQPGAFASSGVPERLHGVITSAQNFLKTAIMDNNAQIGALGDVSSEFEASHDPRPIIERLVTELSAASNRASAMEVNFFQVSRELEKIRASLKEAEQRSNTDALTGLANRRLLEGYLRSAQIAALENGELLSLFMIDIDHFKQFNDRHGHQVGDQVLKLVAKVLQDGVRDGDLAARYGGEELIAVLPGAGLNTCREVAERIRRRISEAKIIQRSTGREIGGVTVSIGASLFRLGEPAEAMIERCDRALYTAKKRGRNRTATEADLDELVDK